MVKNFTGGSPETAPKSPLEKAKEWAINIVREIRQGDSAQNQIRLYRVNVVSNLRKAAKELEDQGGEAEKIQAIRALADEVNNFPNLMREKELAGEDINMADEFEKLANRVQELT